MDDSAHLIGVLGDTHGRLPDSARLICEGTYDPSQVYRCVRIGDALSLSDEADPTLIVPGRAVERIVHTGDVGGQAIISELQTVAPVTAVLGNNDWSGSVIDSDGEVNTLATRTFFGLRMAVAHTLQDLTAAAFGRGALQPAVLSSIPPLLVCGHTHNPEVRTMRGSVLLNPGSTTRPRSSSYATVALLAVQGGVLAEVAFVALVRWPLEKVGLRLGKGRSQAR